MIGEIGRLRYAILFTLLTMALGGSAWSSTGQGGWCVAAVKVYLSLGLFSLAIAYGLKQVGFPVEEVVCQPRWAFAAWVILAPYRILGWLTLGLMRRVDEEAAISRVAPGLFIGRRPSQTEGRHLSGSGIDAVLDLCAEFPPQYSKLGLNYHYVTILDGSPPSNRQFREAVEWIGARRAEGKSILIHCAQGHGKSANDRCRGARLARPDLGRRPGV